MRETSLARSVWAGSLAAFLLLAQTAGAEPAHVDRDDVSKRPPAPTSSDLSRRAAELEAQVQLLKRVAELEEQLKNLQKSVGKASTAPDVTDLTRSRKMSEVGIIHNCIACDDRNFSHLGVPRMFSVQNSENACENALSECNRPSSAQGHCYVYNPAQRGSCGPRSYNSDGRVIENRYECRYRIPGFLSLSLGRMASAGSGLNCEEACTRALRFCNEERSSTSPACTMRTCYPYVAAVER